MQRRLYNLAECLLAQDVYPPELRDDTTKDRLQID
jgi:hypothetical protein